MSAKQFTSYYSFTPNGRNKGVMFNTCMFYHIFISCGFVFMALGYPQRCASFNDLLTSSFEPCTLRPNIDKNIYNNNAQVDCTLGGEVFAKIISSVVCDELIGAPVFRILRQVQVSFS